MFNTSTPPASALHATHDAPLANRGQKSTVRGNYDESRSWDRVAKQWYSIYEINL